MYYKDLRPEIATSFLEEFNANGPKLTLDRVSSKIHISKKTIYRFFQGKDDIYVYLIQDGLKRLLAERQAILENRALSNKEKLNAMLLASTGYEDRIDFTKIPSLKSEAPAVFAFLERAVLESWESVATVLEEGKSSGEVKGALNVPLAIAFLQSCAMKLFESNVLAETGLTFTQAKESLADTIQRGMLL